MNTWAWPDSLDALVAAPDHHSLLFENDDVRVLDARVPRGRPFPFTRIDSHDRRRTQAVSEPPTLATLPIVVDA